VQYSPELQFKMTDSLNKEEEVRQLLEQVQRELAEAETSSSTTL
jgi:hypothetical protein